MQILLITIFGMDWYFLNSEHLITWIFNSILFLWWKCQYSHLANGEVETESQIWLPRMTKAPVMMQLNIWLLLVPARAAPRNRVLCHRSCKFHPAPWAEVAALGCTLVVMSCLWMNIGTEKWQQSQNQKLRLLSSRKSIVSLIFQHISLQFSQLKHIQEIITANARTIPPQHTSPPKNNQPNEKPPPEHACKSTLQTGVSRKANWNSLW